MEFAKTIGKLRLVALAVFCMLLAGHALAADNIKGQVLLGGSPVAKSTVTLWEASSDAPKQLDQAKTSDDGRFEVHVKGAHGDGVLYLVAAGGVPKAGQTASDNPAIVLLSVLGSKPPEKIVVNELTTVASTFTAARFINGEDICGNPLGLRIAARNTPNLVDLPDWRLGQSDCGFGQQHLDPNGAAASSRLPPQPAVRRRRTLLKRWLASLARRGSTRRRSRELFDEAYPRPKAGFTARSALRAVSRLHTARFHPPALVRRRRILLEWQHGFRCRGQHVVRPELVGGLAVRRAQGASAAA